MDNPPEGRNVTCPKCGGKAIAIVPQGSEMVEQEAEADGKVRANCKSCGAEFLAYYRME